MTLSLKIKQLSDPEHKSTSHVTSKNHLNHLVLLIQHQKLPTEQRRRKQVSRAFDKTWIIPIPARNLPPENSHCLPAPILFDVKHQLMVSSSLTLHIGFAPNNLKKSDPAISIPSLGGLSSAYPHYSFIARNHQTCVAGKFASRSIVDLASRNRQVEEAFELLLIPFP